MMAEGTWWLESRSDPRFNCRGEGLVGMFCMPPAAERKMKELEEELGCKAPEDLEFGYMKY